MTLKAPFPYFGGKSRIAPTVWRALGKVTNYVDPFFGSGACLLARPDFDPDAAQIETVNDADGFLANFWRAIAADPDAVAHWADWPVHEADLHARHGWLINRRARLQWCLEDPDFYDPKIAGWWVWGISAWIASGWCSGAGPWRHDGAHLHDGRQRSHLGGAGRGVKRNRPHLGNAGMGVNRNRPHLSAGMGVIRRKPHLGDAGKGVNRKRPHLRSAGTGVNRKRHHLESVREDILADYFAALSARLRRVRVCCGDWSRVMGSCVTTRNGLTGVFLDPPYSGDVRAKGLYAVDSDDVAAAVHAWAREHGDDPKLRVVVCGYECEAEYPESWRAISWVAHGGYAGQRKTQSPNNNRIRERLWLSPHCEIVDA